MADFDPDKFLAETQPDFDPDKFLAETAQQQNAKPKYDDIPQMDDKGNVTWPAAAKTDTSPPSNWDVAKQAAVEGLTGIPDSVINTPSNVLNIGKAAYGTAMTAAGHPEYAPDISEPPSPFTNAAADAGLITQENAPVTTGQKLLAAGVRGAVGGAVMPTSLEGGIVSAGRDLLSSAAIGATSSTAGQAVEEATGSKAAGILASVAIPAGIGAARNYQEKNSAASFAEDAIKNVERNKTTQAAVDNGLIIPPSRVEGAPDSIRAGAASVDPQKMNQKINQQNIKTIDEIARKQMGITNLSDDSIKESNQKWADYGYAPVKSLPDIAIGESEPIPTADLLKNISQDRADAHKILQQIDNQNVKYDPQMRVDAQDLMSRAQANEEALAAHVDSMEKAGKAAPGTMQRYQDARKKIAINNTYKDALNPALGTIDPRFIGKVWDVRGGSNYMTGGLDTIGRFATAYPEVSKAETKVGVSSDKGFYPIARGAAYAAAPLAGAFMGAHFSPEFAAGGALAGGIIDAVPAAARNYVMSPKYQAKLLPSSIYMTSIPDLNYSGLSAMMGIQGANDQNLTDMLRQQQ